MLKLASKDLKLFFKDKRAVLLTFAIPMALITLFAFAFGGVGKTKNDRKVTLLVCDLDSTAKSAEAIALLDTIKLLQIQRSTLALAQETINKGNMSCVLIIHHGFSDSLSDGNQLPLEVQYDEAREIEVGLLQQALIPTVAMLPFHIGNSREMMAHRLTKISGASHPMAKKNIQEQSHNLYDAISLQIHNKGTKNGTNATTVFMGGEIKMTKLVKSTSNNLGLVQAVAGTAVMMLLFSVVGVGMSLIEEKQEGTLKRLLYSPMNPYNILLGKMISANIISIMQLMVMFLYAAVAFGLNTVAHLPGLLMIIVATAFACSAFGVLLASIAKSRQQVQGLSTLIILIMSAIGGSMIPLFFMPVFMQKMAVVSINYWSIQGFFDLFWRNLPFNDTTFISRIGVLLTIGLSLNTLALILFKKNILKLT